MSVHEPQKRKIEIPSWEQVLKRNSIERMKQEKFPLDILGELPQLITAGYEAVPEEDFVRMQWWGLYHDKPKVGTFMLRIKAPGGHLSPPQLRAIGEVSERFGRNYGEISTRQNIQLHWIRLPDLPAVLEHLNRSGLTTAGGCGDTVRNITGCPVAGIDRNELFDVQAVVQEAAQFFYGNREYSNLPRKHKITISSCPFQCNAPEINCIALLGVLKDGRPGFAVRVGGGLTATPRISRDLGVFVPFEEALPVLRAIIDCWKENPRYRQSRVKARLKFMVDDYGVEEYRRQVEERLGHRLEDFPAPSPAGEADHLGVHRQKQASLFYMGLSAPLGWWSAEQMRRIADLAEEAGADIRLTRQQNFILANVPEEKLARLGERVAAAGFPLQRNRLWGRSIACTGEPFCNYSVTETKTKLQEILERLQARFGEAVAELKVHLDGCPHACGKHWVGDVGLQGTTTRAEGGQEKIEAYDLILRGGLGAKTAIGKPLFRRVPSHKAPEYVERLVAAWLHEKEARNGQQEKFGFREFCDEHSDEELVAVAQRNPSDTEQKHTDTP